MCIKICRSLDVLSQGIAVYEINIITDIMTTLKCIGIFKNGPNFNFIQN